MDSQITKPLLILVGGSCGGKTTTEEYLKNSHGFTSLVSLTTREKRPEEIDGEHYHFVPKYMFVNIKTANVITISEDWLYGVPVEEITKGLLDTNSYGSIYSVINLSPACDLISYVRENHREFAPIAVMMNAPKEDRIECMKLRGMSNDEIQLRLSREDSELDFSDRMNLMKVPHMVYSGQLNPNTQSDIAKLFTK